MEIDDETLPGDHTPITPIDQGEEAPPARRHLWEGIRPKNPAVYNLYGALKLRPWAMTDDEIDALLRTRPDLGYLWKVAQ